MRKFLEHGVKYKFVWKSSMKKGADSLFRPYKPEKSTGAHLVMLPVRVYILVNIEIEKSPNHNYRRNQKIMSKQLNATPTKNEKLVKWVF